MTFCFHDDGGHSVQLGQHTLWQNTVDGVKLGKMLDQTNIRLTILTQLLDIC